MVRVAGTLLQQLLTERIWQPMGAEQDAVLLADVHGVGGAGAGLCVGLRDLARFGDLIRCDGARVVRPVIAADVVDALFAGASPQAFAQAGYTSLPRWSYRAMWWVGQPVGGPTHCDRFSPCDSIANKLDAEKTMQESSSSPALVVGMITVRDPQAWAEYRSLVPASLAPWQAELLARGAEGQVLAGHHPHRDVVVIRFPDRRSVSAWYESAAYQALIPLRLRAADVDLMVYEV